MGKFTTLPEGPQVELKGRFTSARGAFLIGGSPSLKAQNLGLLQQPGVLTMAMNNAALHVRPALWVGCDPPGCFDPSILWDPGITKFAPRRYADMKVGSTDARYRDMANVFWFDMRPEGPVHRYLDDGDAVPWFHNTMTAAIYILYHMGVRRIVLLGSDFGAGYAHPTSLSRLERRWNARVYDGLVADLLIKQQYFKQHGLELVDASVHSRLGAAYRTLTLEQALDWLGLPVARGDSRSLLHCSAYADPLTKKRIGGL